MKVSAVPIALALALSLAATGCGGKKGGDISGIDPKVRFVNAFPDADTVKAAVGGSLSATPSLTERRPTTEASTTTRPA